MKKVILPVDDGRHDPQDRIPALLDRLDKPAGSLNLSPNKLPSLRIVVPSTDHHVQIDGTDTHAGQRTVIQGHNPFAIHFIHQDVRYNIFPHNAGITTAGFGIKVGNHLDSLLQLLLSAAQGLKDPVIPAVGNICKMVSDHPSGQAGSTGKIQLR